MFRKLHIYFLVTPLVSIMMLFVFNMCSDDSFDSINEADNNSLTNYSSCKSFSGNIMSDHSSGEECVDYNYFSNGTLSLTHVNAGFNCCPGELTANINIEGGVITIEEFEQEAGCHCNCLFDLDYEIAIPSPGTYTIKIVTPYVDATEQIEFIVDLTSTSNGSYCVQRNNYPWGI